MLLPCGCASIVMSSVGRAFVDMYGKRGNVEDAEAVFEELPKRNPVTWNSIIGGGYAAQGNADLVLVLFKEMTGGGMKHNYATLVSIISACSRGGRAKEGFELFTTMKERFGIEPSTERYACVVDSLREGGDGGEGIRAY